jgi:hypothetical protein
MDEHYDLAVRADIADIGSSMNRREPGLVLSAPPLDGTPESERDVT